MNRWLALFGFVFVLFCATVSSNAAIVDLPDVDGRGYFEDLTTGFIWMDVDNFLGMTYSQIETSLSGTDFHIASYDEVQQLLFTSATLSPPWVASAGNLIPPASHIAAFNEYYDIMGGSGWSGVPSDPTNSNYYRIIWGMYDDLDSVNQWFYYATGPGDYNPSNMAWVHSFGYTDSYALGAFVVDSTSVPIPGAFWLVSSGLMGLLGFKRKQKK